MAIIIEGYKNLFLEQIFQDCYKIAEMQRYGESKLQHSKKTIAF